MDIAWTGGKLDTKQLMLLSLSLTKYENFMRCHEDKTKSYSSIGIIHRMQLVAILTKLDDTWRNLTVTIVDSADKTLDVGDASLLLLLLRCSPVSQLTLVAVIVAVGAQV